MRANRWSRAAFALAGVVVVGLPAGRTVAQTPERHGKTIKQCHDELAANAAALTKAGESPAEFFHTCWWRTAEGHPTPIRGMAKGVRAAAQVRDSCRQAHRCRRRGDGQGQSGDRASQAGSRGRRGRRGEGTARR